MSESDIDWKQEALNKQKELQELEALYNELSESSQTLEQHLELELEKTKQELTIVSQSWEKEAHKNEILNKHILQVKETNDNNIQKLIKNSKDSAAMIEELEGDVKNWKAECDRLKKRLVQLEGENETISNKNRMLEEDVSQLNSKMNKLIEDYVIKQTGHEDKISEQMETIERLSVSLKETNEELSFVKRNSVSIQFDDKNKDNDNTIIKIDDNPPNIYEPQNTDTSYDDLNFNINTDDEPLIPKSIEMTQNFGPKYPNMSMENTIKYLENELENKNKLIIQLKNDNRKTHIRYIGTFIILTIIGSTTYTLISSTKKI